MRAIHPVAGDVFLLCSDGLSGMIDDAAISDILTQRRANPEEAANALLTAANESRWPGQYLRHSGRDRRMNFAAAPLAANLRQPGKSQYG